jgi:hypothetical protein
MKAKRRQELKTNDLAAALEEFIQGARVWGVYALGAVLVVVLIVVVTTYRRNARAEEMGSAYAELRTVSLTTPSGERRTNAEILADLNKMRDLAEGSTDRRFQLDAQVQRGNVALRAAETGPKGIDAEFLPEARAAFEVVRDAARADDAIRYGRALFGLYQVEADAYVVDADPAHRDQAKQILETVRDDARFNGTPYQVMAVRQLNELEKIFEPITFPPQPEPEAPAAPSAMPLGGNLPMQLPEPGGAPVALPVVPAAEEAATTTAPEGELPSAETPDGGAASGGTDAAREAADDSAGSD